MRAQKVIHLKVNGQRFYHRSRVPSKHQKTLGIKNWNRPCGKVSYQQAVVLVTEWAAKHDTMIEALDNPETAAQVCQGTESDMMAPHVLDTIRFAGHSGVGLVSYWISRLFGLIGGLDENAQWKG